MGINIPNFLFSKSKNIGDEIAINRYIETRKKRNKIIGENINTIIISKNLL